jgi:hypothetical protein
MSGNKSSWHDYNESLIERGRVLIASGCFLRSGDVEIKMMNDAKVGAPFQYSDSYIHFLAFLKIGFKIPYRTVEGIACGLTDYVKIVEETHFTYRRRILKIKPSIVEMGFEDDDNDCELITKIIDASGLTISKKVEYIEEKWIRKTSL